MLYRLIILTGPDKGRRITVTEEPMSLGRDADCSVVIDDPDVAKRHAVLEHRRDGLLVRDLGSMNKVLVNQREVREAHLKHGDMIEVGRTRFLVQAAVEANVSGGPGSPRRRKLLHAALVAALAAGIAAAYFFYLSGGEDDVTATASDPPEPASPAPPPPAVTREEIHDMRQDLEAITHAVRELAVRQAVPVETAQEAAAPPAVPEAPAPPPVDPLRAQSERWLADARAAREAGRLEEADALLARVQAADPSFLAAYEERALLFERRGMVEQALAQWSALLRQSTETPEFAAAMAQRARLGQELQKRSVSAAPRVKFGDVRQRRFPATDDYDEMRIFTVDLAPADPGAAFEPADLRVEAWFFDTENASGRVVPSRAVVPSGPLRPGAGDAASGPLSVTATYLVPKGLRTGAAAAEQFHGYVFRLFYRDELQEILARPLTLADAPAGAPGERAVAATTPSEP